ncbi:MAG: TonB-dependent receptor [Gammaproteobacteria bacterium]|nr:TonB-dependent receptor [Gammaproteobacteria bacterium]MDH5304085.1 TonB-dependent receptor [Gammaproteobacteria bacterium]MDH5323095.1 TonB-dependent receptor [Gammaproteobacteria bacterium]
MNIKVLAPTAWVCGLALFAQAGQAAVLEEITVTATKRATGIQDVPISISAVTGTELENAGIEDFDDLVAAVPSLSMKSSGPGRTQLNIRGIAAATGFAPTVSYYIDEMPISTISSGSSTSFAQTVISPKMFDLDRVEVLRGPQGTLFGSSAMGGTVRLITNQPSLDGFEAKVAGEVSSTTDGGTNFGLNGMANLVLGDNAALRLVASNTDRDGYIDRVFDDGAGNSGRVSDVDSEETSSLRASLRFNVTDTFYVQPTYFYQKMEMGGKPNFDGPDSDPLNQYRRFDAAEPFDDEFTMASLTANNDFDSFSVMFNYSKLDREFVNVEDMTDAIDFLGIPQIFDYGLAPEANYVDEWIDLDDETIELRVTSNTDSDLQWLLGYYSKDASSTANYRMQRGFEFVTDLGVANTRDVSDYQEDAFFGEASLEFAEDFEFTLGLRSLDYDFAQMKEDWGYVYDPGAGGLPEDQASTLDVSASDSETHYRATLAWNVLDSTQLYLTSSDATRPGGGNRSIPRSTNPADGNAYACDQELTALGIVGNPTSYGGDSVENLELGIKAEPTDALRFNAAIYRLDWTDIQQRVSTTGACGFNFTANLGKAESTGIEAEFVAAVSDQLTLSAGIGYTKSELKETISQLGITSGDLLPDVPELSVSANMDWTRPLGSGELYFLGSVNYVDETLEIFGSASKDVSSCCTIDSSNVRPSYTLLNLRVGFISDSNWRASVFIDNATDEEAYFSYNDAIVVNVPGFDRTARNRPRTIGVAAQFDF